MVKTFKAFNESNYSNEDIDLICEEYGIENYRINDDRSIDVDGDIDLLNRELIILPLKFRNVSDDFYCYNNELKSLEGSPQSVGGDFDCDNNQLKSLEGAPKSVVGNFKCEYNRLTTLKGAPQSVGGDFACDNNELKTLEGAPKSVGGNFYCDNNPIYKWWKMIDKENDKDVEAFLDFNIHCDDPDDINQEKIDMINNG